MYWPLWSPDDIQYDLQLGNQTRQALDVRGTLCKVQITDDMGVMDAIDEYTKPLEAFQENAAPVAALPEVVPDDDDDAELDDAGFSPLTDGLDGGSPALGDSVDGGLDAVRVVAADGPSGLDTGELAATVLEPGTVVTDMDVTTSVVSTTLTDDVAEEEAVLDDAANTPEEAAAVLLVAAVAEEADEADEPMMVKFPLMSPESPNTGKRRMSDRNVEEFVILTEDGIEDVFLQGASTYEISTRQSSRATAAPCHRLRLADMPNGTGGGTNDRRGDYVALLMEHEQGYSMSRCNEAR
ncbi:hypothetical protein POSPLADRAFT_1048439 [Postia placenta MAD-698-R-SB12]|uniref:Uncharacterized protein n=1 Tax=Postia placenta MAD-698-R-SB12 TaxID=670580 RepID=A0A1X6MUT9_9APHY|nr:hypothetical protein POSPLADRAFT_1048439 [Postia placenta MAD-698-R-SB12]OSX59996.1 hypothetical protein POSPLADRAFT_1048439 [Postia placenta MAD-698-R-SB12]